MTNFEFNKHDPLMTWLDVERRFREMRCGENNFLNSISSIDCYSDGAEITLVNDIDKFGLHAWLADGFGSSLDENDNILTLRIGNVPYLIEVMASSGIKQKQPVSYPLWHDLAYFSTTAENSFIRPTPFLENLHISAFHSFKGGVGRTTALITHLVAYLEQTKKRKTKVLLIDADLEAPGITYWLDVANRPSISFVRFLEAVHYPPSSVEASVQYCAAELRKTSLTLNGAHEVFVLPACVNPDQPTELLDTPVLPEHLARNTKNPWCVGDAIQKLASELGVELVLIDLRAGLSELASPLLFDPRIERFIVSTIAPQSINGAAIVLEKMALLRSLVSDNSAAVPTVILSLLNSTLRESTEYNVAIERLNAAFPAPQSDDDNISSGIVFVEATFDENLMCIRDFRQAIELTKNSSLFNRIKDWVITASPAFSVTKIEISATPNEKSELNNDAKSLEQICEKYKYAENGDGDNLLVTEPLKNLAKHYEKSIPITVSIGAKGAGKTFNFLQLCRNKTWESFLKKLEFDVVDGNETLIFPFLSSEQLKPTARTIVEECRNNCFQKLALTQEFSETDLRDRIRENNTDWVSFWTMELLSAFNVEGRNLKDLNHFFTSKNVRLVILIDGLEDQFPTLIDKPEQKSALEALLSFPNRIEEIRDSHLGIIEFVRSDYVRTVIQQNLGQFEARYKPFKLEWTAESFLRLAYWICAETGFNWADKNDSETLSESELLTKLYQLWGQKLGSTNSKEANAVRWIFTALCDLNGRLQARDLVRFLYHASKHSQSDGVFKWQDRVLLPAAIRRAVGDCSHEKVKEAISEINTLKLWNEQLETISDSEKSVPFDAQQMGLKPEWSKELQELGVIFEDRGKNEEKRFYLPESYRTGLGFSLSNAGRPKVLALIQRNSVKLPF